MPKHQLKTVPLPLKTNARIRAYLEQLVDGGFYGKSPTEAAERLLARTLEALVRKGRLKEVPPRGDGDGGGGTAS